MPHLKLPSVMKHILFLILHIGLFLEKIGHGDIYHLYNVDFLLTVEPEIFFTLIVLKINN